MNRRASLWAGMATSLLAVLLAGCASLAYYRQTLGGHLELMRRQVPIDRVIADPATPPATRERLRQVGDMRRFAHDALDLPDNGSYRSYADLQRSFVLWNVVAAPEFELRAVQSCFPIVGCVDYRGYYAEADARRHAEELRAAGYDVTVGGVAAYSTLGWFHDPVVSTMLRWSETEQAAVIFHELAHQKLYVRDDSLFNESFATAVQEEGLRRWLAQLDRPELTARAGQERRRKREFVSLVEDTRMHLQQLFASRLSPVEMRVAKQQIFEQMRTDYSVLRQSWGGYGGYDDWFAHDLNNAKLLAVSTYYEWTPAFSRLLASENGDLPRFYEDCRRAGSLPPADRRRWLEGWRAAGIGGY
jgi:predicted aminopeptidase